MTEEGEEELRVAPAVIFKISTFRPQSLFMCCLILRKKSDYLPDLINHLVLRLKTMYLCAIRTYFPM